MDTLKRKLKKLKNNPKLFFRDWYVKRKNRQRANEYLLTKSTDVVDSVPICDEGVSCNIVKRATIKMPESATMFYWKGKTNFGDVINPVIMDKLFNIPVTHAKVEHADIIGIGSVLHTALCPKTQLDITRSFNQNILHVFSTGFKGPIDTERMCFSRPVEIHALRGRLTREICERILGYKIDCILADAGLLAPFLLFDDIANLKKTYKLGIIPHFSDNNESLIKYIAQQHTSSVIIDLLLPIDEVIKLISSCEFIISTSLHGCIVADSFNIPNKWCRGLSREILKQKDFKFVDYYSSYDIFDISAMSLLDVKGQKTKLINNIIDDYHIPYSMVKKKQESLLCRCDRI